MCVLLWLSLVKVVVNNFLLSEYIYWRLMDYEYVIIYVCYLVVVNTYLWWMVLDEDFSEGLNLESTYKCNLWTFVRDVKIKVKIMLCYAISILFVVWYFTRDFTADFGHFFSSCILCPCFFYFLTPILPRCWFLTYFPDQATTVRVIM